MIKIKFLIISFIIIIILFHLNIFLKYKNKYEILQINSLLESNKLLKYYNENLPIVILNYQLKDILNTISPLTIKKKFISNKNDFSKKHIIHNKDTLFIISKNNIKINLSIPNELKNFSKLNQYNHNLTFLTNKNNNYKYIQILLKPQNILYIPRKWIFNIIADENDYSIFITETIFSFLFTFYNIVPFTKNLIYKNPIKKNILK